MGISAAAPYEPEGREIVWGQGPPPPAVAPIQLRLRVFGDEYYGRTQTLAGFTVIYSYEDNSYYYAKLSDDGSSLVSTGVLAHLLPPAGLTPRIDLGAAAIIQAAAFRRFTYDSLRKARWDARISGMQIVRAAAAGASFQSTVLAAARENSKPVVGNVVGLTILAVFKGATPTLDRARITNMFNQGTPAIPGIPAVPGSYTFDGNAGSVHNYFSEQSAGKLNLVQLVTTVVELPKTREEYNYVIGPAGKPATDEVAPNARVVAENIIKDALSELQKAAFNFAPLSVDSTGRIRVVNLILQSADSGAYMQGIWPHAGSVTDPVDNPILFGTASRPRIIKEYSMRTVGTQPLTIGPTCHDDAQLLIGFPDLYAYPNMGVGNYCLMGTGSDGSSGSAAVAANAGNATTAATTAVPAIPVSSANGGRRPAPINPHFKDLVGWNTVTEINSASTATVTLPTATATSSVALRFRKVGSATESFIIENRGISKWIAAPQDSGIAIWHVNDAQNGNISSASGQANGVSLEQSDGLSNLENPINGANSNAGDVGDLYKLAKPVFSGTTIPNSLWQDGTQSALQARVLVNNGAISSDVAFGPFIPANTIIVDSPNGSEFAYWNNIFPVSWSANITGNVKIELLKAGILHSLIANNVSTAARNFNWTVPKTITQGSDYKIRISSLTNTTGTPPVLANVFDESDNPFTIIDTAFPRGEVIPYGWVRSVGSLSSWAVSNRDGVDGSFSLASIRPRDGAKSGISYSSNFEKGKISFYLKVSTEANYDFARFYINGVEQFFNGVLGISGETGWQQYEFDVEAGANTFEWAYIKDTSLGELNDSVFLDVVTMPPTTQEILVQKSVSGTVPNLVFSDLQSGIDSTTLPNTKIKSSSVAQTFRIKNEGTADLFGISVKKTGNNAADFIVSALPKSFLLPNETTTFTVVFKPTVEGVKNAVLNILSNDSDESEYTVALIGVAEDLPFIEVRELPVTTLMIDGRAPRTFGSVPIGSTGSTRTFTITNSGKGPLNLQAVTKTGTGAADFIIGALSATVLPQNGTSTFTVTFRPSALRTRSAAIRILNDDLIRGPFDFRVSGVGLAATLTAGSFSSNSFSMIAPNLTWQAVGFSPPTTLEIGGLVYNSLSVQNGSGIVEVSSNLIDWFSGPDFTTVVSNSGSTMVVRDKTPSTESAKRYIRLK
jgi:M6 family metalloprotease-like protein